VRCRRRTRARRRSGGGRASRAPTTPAVTTPVPSRAGRRPKVGGKGLYR
jgi:hypothetical protein